MLSKLAVRRLLRLCDYMESLPKRAVNHFDMNSFLSHDAEHDHPIPQKQKDLLTCGTTACALGWAMTDPYFRRLGLEWAAGWDMRKPEVSGSEDVFELHDDDIWENIFGGSNKDSTPKAWAKRVRLYIKTHADDPA